MGSAQGATASVDLPIATANRHHHRRASWSSPDSVSEIGELANVSVHNPIALPPHDDQAQSYQHTTQQKKRARFRDRERPVANYEEIAD